MKIAFTSCIDAIDDPSQAVWGRIRKLAPDVLVLLGDTMYMDYGIALLGSDRPVGWLCKLADETFATTMHERYKLQWSVKSFRDLLAGAVQLAMVWDDHDFAWNNARGRGTEKHFAVSREKRLIAQGLFRQFRMACAQMNVSTYPAMPPLHVLLGADETGIHTSFDRDKIRFIMLDGRSFREDPNTGPDAQMLGLAQREWLRHQVSAWEGLVVICSGSVMTGSEESWDKYVDYAWLLGLPAGHIIVLSGDIHKNALPMKHSHHVVEVTSSGAARPGLGGGFAHVGGARGNFGMLIVGDRIAVTLYSADNPRGSSAAIKFGA